MSKMMRWMEPLKLRVAVIAVLIFLLLGILQFFAMPSFVRYMIRQNLILSSPEATIYSSWQKTPLPIYNEIYFFNITNADGFLAGRERPHVQEVGPYVFREEREKINISWSHVDGTVAYRQARRYFYEPSMTRGSLHDVITHINVPMVSAVVQLDQMTRELANQDLATKHLYPKTNSMMATRGGILFPKHTVSELLYEGYDERIEYAAPEYNLDVKINMKFGWYAGKNGTASDGTYRVHTGERSIDKLGKVESWNGERELHHWLRPECNRLSDAGTGELSPPFQDPFPKRIKIFVGDLCRSLTLTYKEDLVFKGLNVKRYWASPETFDYSHGSENECYCDMLHGKLDCPPRGIMKLTKCHPGAAVVSFPHMLYAEPRVRDLIDGLNPDCDRHSFLMDIEPTLGVAVRVQGRVQLNVLFKRDSRLDFAANLTNAETYFPAIWTNSRAEATDEMLSQLILVQQKLPVILPASSLVQILVALILLFVIIAYARKYHPTEKKSSRIGGGVKGSTAPPLTAVEYEPVKVAEVPIEEDQEVSDSSSGQRRAAGRPNRHTNGSGA